jgi:hypothetical protein
MHLLTLVKVSRRIYDQILQAPVIVVTSAFILTPTLMFALGQPFGYGFHGLFNT